MSKRGRARRSPGRRIADRITRRLRVEWVRHDYELERAAFWIRLGAGEPPRVG